MPGSITPLPVMEEEAKQPKQIPLPPKTIVCSYGYMKQIAELPYNGGSKPGCGTKLVIRTNRGIELAEMLTTTCPNAGCGSSVTRKQMLSYIDSSGGRDYPFTTQGKVLRIAVTEDINEQARIDARKQEMIRFTKGMMKEMDLAMRLVDVEPLLGGERIIFHYTAEQWVDFRELVRRLASEYQTRIEMHQVNARDEARLVADYEKCGQHCCCKQFLKVLKPISMRSAKVQKATLDPSKISGRCGRLMCCLRYEDETYESLRKKLPHRKSRVKTDDGPGTVLDSQILTQLVLVRLDSNDTNAAYPVENIQILSKEEDAQIREAQALAAQNAQSKWRRSAPPARRSPGKPDKPSSPDQPPTAQAKDGAPDQANPDKKRRRRRRRRNRDRGDQQPPGNTPPPAAQ